MTDTLWNAQTAVYSVLIAASPAICGGRVYDHVPQDVSFPYVKIGESHSQPDDTICDEGTDELLTLHVWSRYRGQKEIKEVTAAIHTALHQVDLTVTGRPYAVATISGTQSFDDPDGLTRHGVIQVKIRSYE